MTLHDSLHDRAAELANYALEAYKKHLRSCPIHAKFDPVESQKCAWCSAAYEVFKEGGG
jgi:hypothetical protein